MTYRRTIAAGEGFADTLIPRLRVAYAGSPGNVEFNPFKHERISDCLSVNKISLRPLVPVTPNLIVGAYIAPRRNSRPVVRDLLLTIVGC